MIYWRYITLFFLFTTKLSVAEVQVQLDRSEVYEGDLVELVVTYIGRDSVEPDLSVLDKDFTIVSTNTGSYVSIVNGARSDKNTWTLRLQPKRKGILDIPPIQLGTESTRLVQLKVTEIPAHIIQRQKEHVFVESRIETTEHPFYVQQQIPYTVWLYYDENVLKGELSATSPGDAVVEKLGKDKQYVTERNNRRYNVIERHYAISPQRSGQLIIPPAKFQGQLAAEQQRQQAHSRRDRFIDQFFSNDPFLQRQQRRRPGMRVQIASNEIVVDVQAKPKHVKNNWLPAESILITDSWAQSPPSLRVGEPVNRTITVEAKGVTAAQIPALAMPDVTGVKVYSEPEILESQTDGHKIYGVSKQTFSYIPKEQGVVMIPAIELHWWDTINNTATHTNVPEWQLHVRAGSGGLYDPPIEAQADQVEDNEVNVSIDQPGSIASSGKSQINNIIIFLIAVVVLLLAIVIIGWFRSKAKSVFSSVDIDSALTKLESACVANCAVDASKALLSLAALIWPDQPPVNLGAIGARMPKARQAISELDKALYMRNSESWSGEPLWLSVSDTVNNIDTKVEKSNQVLPDLYPKNI